MSFLRKQKPVTRKSGPGEQPPITPAPNCRPSSSQTVTATVAEWGEPVHCRTVRADHDTKDLVISLTDSLGWSPFAEPGTEVIVGWADHDRWHEAKARFTGRMAKGTRILRLQIVGGPIHHERRRHLRVRMNRPVEVHTGRDKVNAVTVDMSETAMRVVVPMQAPLFTRDEVHVLMKLVNHRTGAIAPLALDGHVLAVRELSGKMAGRKEVVVFYDELSPSQIDHVRGVVYQLDLREKRGGELDDEAM
jgi:hypothetical protein